MRFLVLMTEPGYFTRPDDEARDAAEMADLERFVAAVAARGEVVAGEALAGPSESRSVLPGPPAQRAVTDGPFAEAAEQIGGLFLVDLPDLDAATEVARLLPEAYTVEVRPVLDLS
jgi:hypothetical protein